MIDSVITGKFGQNVSPAGLSENKKADQSASFADMIAKSMSSLLASSNGAGSFSTQMKMSNKSSIDNVFTKNSALNDSQKKSSAENLTFDKTARTQDLSQNNCLKEEALDDEQSKVQADEEEEDADSKEAVKQMMSAFLEDLKQILGVSDETFEEAMSSLGFTASDLFDAGNTANLIAQISGKQDAMSVITDADLSAKLKDIMQYVSDMLSNADTQYGISAEQLQATAQQMTDDGTVNKEFAGQKAQEDLASMQSDKYALEEGNELEQAVSEKLIVHTSVNKTGGTSGDNFDSSSERHTFDHSKGHSQVNVDINSGMNVAAQVAGTFEAAFAEGMDNVRPVDIVRQVIDSIKLNVTSEVKSMEVALNPENLGKVSLLVSVRNGVVTAKLVAENEQVKKALEGQLNILKENMENQGLKVDAIEVTIQSNAFQGQEHFNGSRQQQQTNGTKKHIGSLNLTDDNEIETEQEQTIPASENSSVEFSA